MNACSMIPDSPGARRTSVGVVVRSSPSSILAVGIAFAAWIGVSSIVARPQPATAADIDEAETATRRAAVARICGGWIVLNCIIAGWVFNANPTNGGELPQALVVVGFVISLTGILTGWAWVPTRGWRKADSFRVAA